MGESVPSDPADSDSLDHGRPECHRLRTSGWHTQRWLRPAHGRPIHSRRGVAHDASAAPDKRGASASVPPKTLRPTGSAGLHSSRRPSLVGEKTKRRRNAGPKELECHGCSLKCVVNYGQFVCYKKRPSSRANDTAEKIRISSMRGLFLISSLSIVFVTGAPRWAMRS